ncbi:MAG: alpha/beta hydrolase [Phycisphaerales bacterium]
MHAVPRLTPRPRLIYALILAAGLMGCEHQLMPTPNIYASGRYDLVGADYPVELRSSTVELLYVTDRKRVDTGTANGSVKYGWKRSPSLAIGICEVEIGKGLDWKTLAESTTRRERRIALPERVRSITEIARLQPTPTAVVEQDGMLVPDPDTITRRDATAESVAELFRERLAQSRRSEVLIYIHGFKMTFEEAAIVLAGLHHFSRDLVPILYTWPAGAPGVLSGYARDRESGEFTVLHLKRFIRRLAALPELEKIHIVAHSRGTDVAVTALRELLIEERGAGRLAEVTFKIANLVLVAPDLDVDVVSQRFIGERMHNVADYLTIYVSRDDRAIGVAEWFAQSTRRLGRVQPQDISEPLRRRMEIIDDVALIDVRVKSDKHGHSYFYRNPAVSSDLLLMVRHGALVGSPQRPLTQIFPGYWVLDDPAYPGFDSEQVGVE